MSISDKYDVIVVGGGHAGTEACHAAAEMGCSVLLVTMKLDNIGEMSCNPAIGGVAKGHLVKEIDAMGGIMGRAADAGGIQFRILNSSKGAAVHSSRAQEDRKKYKAYVKEALTSQENLTIMEGQVERFIYDKGNVRGVEVGKSKIFSEAVILTPGTFLNGMMHIGLNSFQGGRIEEGASVVLSESLKEAGFGILRFKTGTCARLDGKTIDFSGLDIQHGDAEPRPFSFVTERVIEKQVPCYITHTDEKTHEIIRSGFERSPLYTGVIEGTGVRYCPSVEDKIVRFAHMKRHQVFLEPEGLDTDIYYPNGISTSLPEDVQEKFIHSIKGLENVKIVKYGYGIEYDVIDPVELYPTMETKKIENLYLAGQINGTTGYEEAAAQGLVSGINAALKIKGRKPLVLKRHQAYIGVLLDDLVTKGTREPYRMFTSRAEYRLLLREDNAQLRLTDMGRELGCVDELYYNKFVGYKKELERGRKIIKEVKIKIPKKTTTAKELLKHPGITWNDIKKMEPNMDDIPDYIARELDIETKYEGYIKRQEADIKRMSNIEDWIIDKDVDYKEVKSLSNEIIEKLSMIRPQTLGQVSRISGVTPAAISALLIYLKSRQEKSSC
ncbi:tRNA uridine-5-carboxymethylaminomethyl(34) synthesis enzyme MnmG [Elusimicrobiota bacterium]